jgi:hypothetical protein
MSTVNGDTVFYISDLAQHTKNLLANNKMCLTVFSGSEGAIASDEDPNARARLRFIGGFGDINWISKDAWTLPTPEWLSGEENMVQHMNENHGTRCNLCVSTFLV